MTQKTQFELDGVTVTLETGKVARYASGAVWVSCEGTVLLATATADLLSPPGEELALTVQYQEKLYATGRIPGAFTRRQGKRSDREILIARCTDRCLRPLFPAGWGHATEVVVEVMSINPAHPPQPLALLAASAALMLSEIPFDGPVTALHLHRSEADTWASGPAPRSKHNGEVMVGVSHAGILMLEGQFKHLPESALLEAATLAQERAQPALEAQRTLQQAAGKPKRAASPLVTTLTIPDAIITSYQEAVLQNPCFQTQRHARAAILEAWLEEDESATQADFDRWERAYLYEQLQDHNQRLDARGAEDLRAPSGSLDTLPYTHGNALFSRGDTQVMAVTTLGGQDDELLTETLTGMRRKRFFVHYNFPSYAAGRQGRFGHWGRREIGHGHLIERALRPVLPSRKEFAHTISLITEVLSANGSSSMASVCGGTLSLLSAGVPLTHSIAGVAVGMLAQDDEYKLLLDPVCQEDALGEMDCKVCGSREGITAIQMDLKRSGLTIAQLQEALALAKVGRLQLLDAMDACLDAPRPLSPNAPRQALITISVPCAKSLLGSGGKKLRRLKEKSGAKIVINTSGSAQIQAPNQASLECVEALLQELEAELPQKPAAPANTPPKAPQTPPPKPLRAEDYEPPLQVGTLYKGRVTHLKHYGAFVEIQQGAVGLLHISELTYEVPAGPLSEYAAPDQELTVKLLHVDAKGRIGLSLRQASASETLAS